MAAGGARDGSGRGAGLGPARRSALSAVPAARRAAGADGGSAPSPGLLVRALSGRTYPSPFPLILISLSLPLPWTAGARSHRPVALTSPLCPLHPHFPCPLLSPFPRTPQTPFPVAQTFMASTSVALPFARAPRALEGQFELHARQGRGAALGEPGGSRVAPAAGPDSWRMPRTPMPAKSPALFSMEELPCVLSFHGGL